MPKRSLKFEKIPLEYVDKISLFSRICPTFSDSKDLKQLKLHKGVKLLEFRSNTMFNFSLIRLFFGFSAFFCHVASTVVFRQKAVKLQIFFTLKWRQLTYGSILNGNINSVVFHFHEKSATKWQQKFSKSLKRWSRVTKVDLRKSPKASEIFTKIIFVHKRKSGNTLEKFGPIKSTEKCFREMSFHDFFSTIFKITFTQL